MKFKEYIKAELNEKEIPSSERNWELIQARLNNQKPAQTFPLKRYVGIAAAMIGLLIGLGVYFNFNSSNRGEDLEDNFISNSNLNSTSQEIIEEKTPNENSGETKIQTKIPIQEFKIAQTNLENSSSNLDQQIEEIITNQPVQIIENQLNQNNQEIQKEKIQLVQTQTDTIKNKKKFVDPNMLLYSVENKELIKETNNQKSKVATLDLNSLNQN